MRPVIILASEILKEKKSENQFHCTRYKHFFHPNESKIQKIFWRQISFWVIDKSIGFVPITLLNIMAEQ